MSLGEFFSNELFHGIAPKLQSACEVNGIEFNYRYFDEAQDPACLHLGLDNDYALIQIVLWETGLLEFNSQPNQGAEQFQASRIEGADPERLQQLLDQCIVWLVGRQSASELHVS